MKLPDRWTTENGIVVLHRRDSRWPLVFASFLFRFGSREESPREAGHCSMTVDLLMQGTRSRSARVLAREIESVGASMGTQVHEDYSEFGFVAPSAEFDRALKTSAEIILEPKFPHEEIEKERSHVLAALKSRGDILFNVAYDPLGRLLYGDHPYGRPLEGSEERIRALGRPDLKRWHDRFLRPEKAILSLVTPFKSEDISRRLKRFLSAWRSHPGPAARSQGEPAVSSLKSAQRRDVKAPFEQAYLMVGRQAPHADHPDHLLLKIANAILGGGMSSRLFVELRERRGLAYEVSSFFPTRVQTSHWVIYLGLPKEKLRHASSALQQLLDRLAERGPTADEVFQAKRMIRGSYLMDQQSRRRQAWYSAWWELLGRTSNFGEEFLRRVDSVTPGQLRECLRRILAQPSATVTVIPR